jgi:hypothetical protein
MLDDRQWMGVEPSLRWIIDRHAPLSPRLESWIETWSGDRLPGEVLQYLDGQSDVPAQPASLVMQSATPARPPRQQERAVVRLQVRCVRRIVWANHGHPYQPGTARLRDGRLVRFRALRWGSDSITVLTDAGRRDLSFQELAELNLPVQSAWEAIEDESALLSPNQNGLLLQLESSSGAVITTAWQRQRVMRPQDPTKADRWLLGVQPAWSLDVLWLEGERIAVRRFYGPDELPLSRLAPNHVVQRSPLAGQGRPWQRDRNVDGGWLASGPGRFGWGFGVHAENQMHFELPPRARAISLHVGLDTLAGDRGCALARVSLRGSNTRTLYESPLLIGSQQVHASGPLPLGDPTDRTLVLHAGAAHRERPAGADPLDICDSVDWLDPLVELAPIDPTASVWLGRVANHIHACRQWQWIMPAESAVQFWPVWDELSQSEGRFTLGVAVTGTAPLQLRKSVTLSPSVEQMLITVTCARQADPPARIEVLADGTSLATIEVPVLDRGHLQLEPKAIPLQDIKRAPERPVELEIRQLPSAAGVPVQWHAVEFQ